LVGALALVSLPRSARAGGGAATDAYEGISPDAAVDFHGLVDAYGQANLASSSSNVVGRAFDDHAGTPRLGLARLTLAHAPETFGFRVDLGVGDLADAYQASDPAQAAHPDVARAFSYVEQAFVTAVVPVGRGLSLDLGKFGTPVGLEENENPTNWNYSRGMLFTLAEPTYHTGLRATYPVTGAIAVSGFWLNGWNANVVDGDGLRSFGGAVTWQPHPRAELAIDYVGGLERAATRLFDPTLTFRHELDLYATYALSDGVGLAATADYGHDDAGGGSTWGGVGGYLHLQMLSWLAWNFRGEEFLDTDGFTTGVRQRIAGFTTTLEARYVLGPVTSLVRLEYRRDQSDTSAAYGGKEHQDTLGLGVMAFF
jgi:hypothetical protein